MRESHAQPITGTPQPAPQLAHGDSAITFLGHSSFLVQAAGTHLLVDPVFATRLVLLRRQRRPGIRLRDLPSIDAVLLTHAHMDHLNRPSLRGVCRLMRKRHLPAPIAIVPRGVADLVTGLGFREVRELGTWEQTRVTGREATAPLTITATPARHWGARMFRDTHRGFGGYVMAGEACPTIYHSGDTAYFDGFAEIGRRLAPEIALLPIGAYFPDSYRAVHTSPEEALQAFVDLDPRSAPERTMVPMHFGTFRLGREPMDEPLPRLLRAAEARGLSPAVHPLREGETLRLPAKTPPLRASEAVEFAVL